MGVLSAYISFTTLGFFFGPLLCNESYLNDDLNNVISAGSSVDLLLPRYSCATVKRVKRADD